MSFRSRVTSLVAVVLLAVAVPISAAPAASAADVGYIRLAHLSPDTPKVDVWLTSFRDKKFSLVVRSVPYGTLSPFQRLQPGTYNVSMRSPGAPADSKPLLSTNLRVRPGGAYTVAGVGRRANISLKVLTDDLRPPAPGTARLRLVQASSAAKVVDVTTSTGRALVTDAAFPSATPYVSVPAQRWTLTVGPKAGGALSATRTVDVKAGAIYTLLLLDKNLDDVKLVVRTDSAGTPNVPVGAVAAGLGGAADPLPGSPVRPLAALLGLALAAAIVAVTSGGSPPAGGTVTRPAVRPSAPTGPAVQPDRDRAARDAGGSPAAGRPVSLAIPAIGVRSTLERLGTDAAGALVPPRRPMRAGWYAAGPAPGDLGPAVIAGHVDSRRGPAVFWRLTSLRPGDLVTVTRADGERVRFRVTDVRHVDRAAFPTRAVYGPVPDRALRLITCGGTYDHAHGRYRQNVVVFALAV